MKLVDPCEWVAKICNYNSCNSFLLESEFFQIFMPTKSLMHRVNIGAEYLLDAALRHDEIEIFTPVREEDNKKKNVTQKYTQFPLWTATP